MARLSILITHHNEPQEITEPLIASIENQVNIDFSDIDILWSNDCVEIQNIGYFQKYPKVFSRIRLYHATQVHNIGAHRQFLIDNCSTSHFILCDCDDLLYSNLCLYKLLSDIDNYPDVAVISYNEMTVLDNKLVQFPSNFVFVHGKLYNKELLDAARIRFSDELVYCEDTYFCWIILLTQLPVVVSDFVSYIYMQNNTSTSHTEVYYSKFFRSQLECIEMLYKYPMQINKYDVSAIYYAIPYLMYRLLSNAAVSELALQFISKEQVEHRIAELINAFDREHHCFDDIVIEQINDVFDKQQYEKWLAQILTSSAGDI